MNQQRPVDSSVTSLADGYWLESRRPLASLVFIAPWLLAYEAGVLLLGPSAVRNGADAWLRQFLDLVGFGQYFLLPCLTVCILLGWHYVTRQPWRISRGLFWGMAGECIGLAFCLRLWSQVQGLLTHGLLTQTAARPMTLSITDAMGTIVGFLGAGIYEELLFRLILLSLAVWGLARLGLTHGPRWTAAVLLTSLLFAAAHYVGPHGDPLDGHSFLFRFLAGGLFSVLFLCRGFGIAAGTHASYDILVGW